MPPWWVAAQLHWPVPEEAVGTIGRAPSKDTSVTALAISSATTGFTRHPTTMHADIVTGRIGHKDIVVTAGRSIGRIVIMPSEWHRIRDITAVPGILGGTSQSIA